MKAMKHIILLLLAMIATTTISAKQLKTQHMYVVGFSASFTDSVIYITDVQDVQGAWYDTKGKFLMGCDNYSYQLKEYLAEKTGQKNRICMVFFATNKKKAEKKYQKIKKKYADKAPGMYDVKFLSTSDFKFEVIDFTPEEETFSEQ